MLTYDQFKNRRPHPRAYSMMDRRILNHNVRMLVRENDPDNPNPLITPQGRRIERQYGNHIISILVNERNPLPVGAINNIMNAEVQTIRNRYYGGR